MLFINFTGEGAEALKSKYREVAASFKGQGLSFLLGDAENSQGAFQKRAKFLSSSSRLLTTRNILKQMWRLTRLDRGSRTSKMEKLPHIKNLNPSQPKTNEPVKVVVAENLDEMVFNSGKNVLLEFYAPWCGHCQKLVPILDEVAVTQPQNDFPNDTFDVKGFPTIYLRSASGNIVVYEGDRTKEDIISFIDKNKDTAGEPKKEETTAEAVKDEL
ncbi:Protein disulfide isomerase-like 1-1 [Raphanus sativus]|nr:Protein disulfide isomerase-like 1-1 [Raphanus sativus]